MSSSLDQDGAAVSAAAAGGGVAAAGVAGGWVVGVAAVALQCGLRSCCRRFPQG